MQISENSKKTTMVEYYFSKVTGLLSAILLKQDPTSSAVVKTFQNFQGRYFYITPLDNCFWIYRQQSWFLSLALSPTGMWGQGGRGRVTSSEFYVRSLPG